MAGFPEDGIRNLHEGRDHFWFRHRNAVVERALRQALGSAAGAKVLELGCGSAIIGGHLQHAGFNVTVSDRDSGFLAFVPPGMASLVFDLTRDTAPDEARGTFDALVLGDVIEHLKDPAAALRRARDFLRPGGRLVVTVPALQALWSDYDVQSMHEKRYGRDDLREEMRAAGFTVDRVDFFMGLPALLLYVQRRLALRKGSPRLGRDSLRISPLLNRLLFRVMQVEHWAAQSVRLPFGSSLLATGTKP